jgi:membrane protease subunit (stomatin/prohibitin family)
MALIDVIKCETPSDSFFAWKFDSTDINFGSQLIVGEGQVAIFVKGGEALDTFHPGTYTLKTGNIPLLEKLINLPFGGDTPYSAEVWFISTTIKRDLKWGTATPIPLLDKSIGFPVSLRAFGKWGIRIDDPRAFLLQFVGSQSYADDKKIVDYLIGEIIQKISDLLAEKIREGMPVLEINAELNELSNETRLNISDEFNKYGIEVINYNIENINIPNDELSKIQDVYIKTFEAKELSNTELTKSYAAIKSFEVLGDAANNSSDGGVGAMMSAGIGLGAGLPLGQQMGQQMSIDASQNSSQASDDPKSKLLKLKQLLDESLITQAQFDEKQAEILKDL